MIRGVPLQVRKVAQTEVGGRGNCFEACVATLTGRTVEAVPVYTESNVDQRPYLARLDRWLAGLGLRVVTLNRGDCPPDDRVPDYIGSDTFWIAGLEISDAGYHHAVVMRGPELYWDPEGAADLASWPDLLHRVRTVTLLVTAASAPDED